MGREGDGESGQGMGREGVGTVSQCDIKIDYKHTHPSMSARYILVFVRLFECPFICTS